MTRRRSNDHDPAARVACEDCAMNTGGAIDATADTPATALPADVLRDDEVVILALKPHPLFIILSSLTSLLVIGIITMLLAYLAKVPWISWTDAQAFGLGAMLVFVRLVWQALEWWNRVYILTDRRIIRRAGVLRISMFEAPLRQVQHTHVFVRVRERLFGLGTIGFATAGTGVFDTFWTTVSKPFAVHRTVTEAIERYGRRR